jgi:carbonic anhydrase
MKTPTLPLAAALLLLGLAGQSREAPREDKTASDRVLADLEEGNKRFIGDQMHGDGGAALRLKLLKEQHPEAIVLSCSDSRVPPEYVFDESLGKLFVIRVAGPVAGPSVLASIDYAVRHLGPRLLVVLGHERCGAVTAAVSASLGRPSGSGELGALVALIQDNLKGRAFPPVRKDPAQRAAAQANVEAVARQIVERSSDVREAVAQGRLRIVGAIYSLESGRVQFLDAADAGKAR